MPRRFCLYLNHHHPYRLRMIVVRLVRWWMGDSLCPSLCRPLLRARALTLARLPARALPACLYLPGGCLAPRLPVGTVLAFMPCLRFVALPCLPLIAFPANAYLGFPGCPLPPPHGYFPCASLLIQILSNMLALCPSTPLFPTTWCCLLVWSFVLPFGLAERCLQHPHRLAG